MIVIYTFDASDRKLNHEAMMLNISIYTVLRELDSIVSEIRIYTNSIDKINAILLIKTPKLKLLVIPVEFSSLVEKSSVLSKESEDNCDRFRSIGGHFGAAHARTFILPLVMKETGQDILYLDGDTGIAKNQGKNIVEFLNDCNILTDVKTYDSIYLNILQQYKHLKTGDIPEWLSKYAVRWCCGIFYIKGTTQNKGLLKEIRDLYVKLTLEIGFLSSNDEYAIGLALHLNNIIPSTPIGNKVFYSLYFEEIMDKDIGPPFGIVHYTYQKSFPEMKIKLDEMLGVWKLYLSGKSSIEPCFVEPLYLDFNSWCKYVWGRFESL